MNRILDFTPSQEEALVARVLVLVHQTIDDALPAAEKATRQFTKTVFSDDNEKTAIGRPGDGDQFSQDSDTARHFADAEDTGPTKVPPPVPGATPDTPPAPPARSGGHNLPPPPRKEVTQPHVQPARADRADKGDKGAPSYVSQLNPVGTPNDKNLSGSTAQSGMIARDALSGPDWVTRFTLAMLIAGLVLLAYALFS